MNSDELAQLVSDLRDERESLLASLESFDYASWDLVTPAEPWTIRHQLTHLCVFDDAAHRALVDPGGFAASVSDAGDLPAHIDRTIHLGDGRSGANSSSGGARLRNSSPLRRSQAIPTSAWPGLVRRPLSDHW